MRDTVYFLAFEGFADWQAALALCEIRRPGEWQLRTVGFSMQPVVSSNGVVGVIRSSWSAAIAVIGLNVDPVGPTDWIARLSSGKFELGSVRRL